MKNKIRYTPILFCSLLLITLTGINGQLYAQRTVTGTVTGEISADLLPGVNILIKGTSTGTTTDSDGYYEIATSTPSDTLVFSYIGYRMMEIPIDGRDVIDVILEPDVISGEELVVVGYGEQTRESIVGSISSISGAKIERAQGPGNLISSLQGSAPGITMFSTNETPGESGAQIQIRASTTLGNTSPLFIVDGVEQPRISNIDKSEIESVSILKEASATAVYGVKGANGVVIIKTKRGRPGSMELSFSTETTIKQPTKMPEFLNAYETLSLRNESYRNDGRWDMIIPDNILEHYRVQDMPYIYPDFDWVDFLYEPAIDQRYNINASGGNEFVRYFASFSYLRENDIMNMGDMRQVFPYEMDPTYRGDRYNFRNNLDFSLTQSTNLSIQLGGNINVNNRPIDDYTQELMFQPATALPYYPADALNQYPDDVIPYNQTGVRPYINPEQGNVRLLWIGGSGVRETKRNDLTANLIFNQGLDFITSGLNLELRYSYQTFQNYGRNHWTPNFYGYNLQPDGNWQRYTNVGDLDLNTPQGNIGINPNMGLWDANRSHDYRVQVDYRQNLENHNFALTGVIARRESMGIASFPSFEESWIARGTYNYQSRYFLESSVAHTGSEKFAQRYRFGTFPSFGAGWMITNEDFMRNLDSMSWINHLKLRYSWGEIGSDAGIPRWLFSTSYGSGGTTPFGFPLQSSTTLIQEAAVPVTDATWETAIKQNLGLEMGFFNNQITLNVDVYNELRKDILQTRNSIPTWMGTSSPVSGNLGEAKAHGIEIELGLNQTFGNGLNLYVDGHFSAFESRVTYWDETDNIPFHLKVEGKPVDLARRMDYFTPTSGVEVVGFYQNFDELFMYPRASGTPPIVGDHKYLDFNGDGVVDGQDRLVAEAPFVPDQNWNVNLGFNIKNWSGQVTFYGVSEVKYPMRQGGMFFLYPFSQNKDNAMTIHADRWTPDNPNARFPSVHSFAEDQYNYRPSSFSMVNGQFIRLKQAFLSYNLTSDFLSGVGVRQIELTLTGTNLWTWTASEFGGDPEGANWGQDFGAYPLTRRFTLGTRINF